MKYGNAIQFYARAARSAGFKVGGKRNGGGWKRLAKAVGLQALTKQDAKRLLRERFGPAAAVVHKQRTFRQVANVNSDSFLESYEWRKIRMEVLKRDGAVCACCGATRIDGVKMHVDHIKPRRIYPELALDITNLQVLCEVCNHGKGNWDMTDWRESSQKSALDIQAFQHLAEIARK